MELVQNHNLQWYTYTCVCNMQICISRFIYMNVSELDAAAEQLEEHGPPEALWDSVAPGTEEAEQQAADEGVSAECPMDPADIQADADILIQPPPDQSG